MQKWHERWGKGWAGAACLHIPPEVTSSLQKATLAVRRGVLLLTRYYLQCDAVCTMDSCGLKKAF